MRVWWTSVVFAIVFCGTGGVGVSTAEAGYIACSQSSEMWPSDQQSNDPVDRPDDFDGDPGPLHAAGSGLPSAPVSSGTSSTLSSSTHFVRTLTDSNFVLTSESMLCSLLVQRSDDSPGNPIIDGLLRPPCLG